MQKNGIGKAGIPEMPEIQRALVTGEPWPEREVSGLLDDDYSDYAFEAKREERLGGDRNLNGFCKICGNSLPEGRRTLCSDKCKNVAYCRERARRRNEEVQADEFLPSCKFNRGVICLEQEGCEKCGWNPVVAEERLIRFLNAKVEACGK